jgi:tetratricopeptide (TPR) repeat protein
MISLSADLALILTAVSTVPAYPRLEGGSEALYLADSTGIVAIRYMPEEALPEGIESLLVVPPSTFAENPEILLVGASKCTLYDLGTIEFRGTYNSAKSDWWFDEPSGTVMAYSQMPFSAYCFTCAYAPGEYPSVLVLTRSGEEDPSAEGLERTNDLLEAGRLADAYAQLGEIFYPGHYYSDAEMAAAFLRRGHELALAAWEVGDGEGACSLMTEGYEIASSIYPLTVTAASTAGDPVLPGGLITQAELVEIENDRGFFLAETGRPSSALPALEWVVETDPGRAVARLNLADVLWELGRTADAVPHYEEYLRLLVELDRLDRAPDRAFERTGFTRPE